MDRRLKRYGASLFALIHLLNKKIYGLKSNLINLLSHSTDWDDCLAGDRRIVEADQKEIFREFPVFSYEQVHKYVGLCIVGDEQALFLIRISL